MSFSMSAFFDSLKAAGNSIPLWVERDSRLATWGTGYWALGIGGSSPCPMPHPPCPKTPSPCGWSFSFSLLIQYLRTWAAIGLLCLVFTWSFPAQAASQIDPQLEQKVLQIIRKHPQAIIESVQAYQQLQQQELKQAQQAFLQDLKTNLQTVIGESPTTGSTQSKTVLIEFSDFQCPYCAEAHKTLKKLLVKYPNKVRLVYKNLPLVSIHAEALPSAAAAWAAYQQGKFWEYHDALFTNQKQLGGALYLDIAKKLNLDLGKFKRDLTLATPAITKDIQLAEKLGVAGTPFFVINSPTISGVVQLANIEKILADAK